MDLERLGPLERALLGVLLRFEAVGVPLSLAQLWRLLPGYTTHLTNVVAALAPDAPLAGFICERRGQYALRDRGDLHASFPGRRRQGGLLWTRVRPALEALCRDPSVCGLALAGPMAWGLPPDDGADIELFVVCAAHRQSRALASVQSLSSKLPTGAQLQVAELLQVDCLSLEPGGRGRAMQLAALRAVLSENLLAALWEHNSWLAELLPNFDPAARLSGDVPDAFLGEDLQDRRSLLRRAFSRRTVTGAGLLRMLGRRGIQRRLSVTDLTPAPSISGYGISAAQLDEHASLRGAQLADWLLPELQHSADYLVAIDEPEEAPAASDEPDMAAVAAEDEATGAPSEGGAGRLPDGSSADISQRVHGNRRVQARARSVAGSEVGQRSPVRGRKPRRSSKRRRP
ncbi:MAG: hypothetical protein CMP23_01200 [Rickettsiales bacterium]|nr:hypothetical protein [Rickettsiales bacterium]